MKPQILVVDDIRDNLRLLSNMLAEQGYKVRPVPDGHRAISSARSRPPDLILLDIMMPGMDGYEVCKRLKADEQIKDIPVIFLSALNETMDKVRAFQIGGVDYITKPFQAEEVLVRVKTHLELAGMRKRLQAQNTQLQRTNDQLAREIVEHKRTKDALQRAKDAALEAQRRAEAAQKASEAANRAKSVFLSNMSHELRSPLTAILGFAQVMTRSQTLTPENKENIGIIQRSGEHLLTLINQVLELAKIEAGRMTLDETDVDLYRLLADVEDMFRLRAQEKNVQFLVELSEQAPQYIRTDGVKLRQVLINLLNNAVKFTEEGNVTLKIEEQHGLPSQSSQPVSGQALVLQFSISDTGPGIAPEELDELFDAFVQTETGRQANEGTGLGLPISRKFVQLMGGDMQVKSKVGHGTVFTFTIKVPVVEAKDTESRLPARRVIGLEPGQPRYRMLIVDDRLSNRRLVFKLLTPFGFDLREAANGKEALELYEAWKPHLIWMDMRMPVMDGYEATKEIRRAEEQRKPTPPLSEGEAPSQHGNQSTIFQPVSGQASIRQSTIIIAMTASSFEEDRIRILSTECDDYLRKPFREEELFALLSKHLGVRFVYKKEEQKAEDRRQQAAEEEVLSLEALAALPTEWLGNLKQGTEEVDVERLFSIIEQIRGRDAALANTLTRLAEDFEYDEILVLLQQVEDKNIEK